MQSESLSAVNAGILADMILNSFDQRLMPAVVDWLEHDAPQHVIIDKADSAYIMDLEGCSFIQALCICNVRLQSLERYANLAHTRKRDIVRRALRP